jgi:hypothetical protein
MGEAVCLEGDGCYDGDRVEHEAVLVVQQIEAYNNFYSSTVVQTHQPLPPCRVALPLTQRPQPSISSHSSLRPLQHYSGCFCLNPQAMSSSQVTA